MFYSLYAKKIVAWQLAFGFTSKKSPQKFDKKNFFGYNCFDESFINYFTIMKTKFNHLGILSGLAIALFVIGITFADTIMTNLDSRYLENVDASSESYSQVTYPQWWDNGYFIWWSTVDWDFSVTMDWVKNPLVCLEQIRGYYFNPARWETILPLDEKTLDEVIVKWESWYDEISMEWGLYTTCFSTVKGNTVDPDAIFGYVKYTNPSQTNTIWAWVSWIDTENIEFTETLFLVGGWEWSDISASGWIWDSVSEKWNVWYNENWDYSQIRVRIRWDLEVLDAKYSDGKWTTDQTSLDIKLSGVTWYNWILEWDIDWWAMKGSFDSNFETVQVNLAETAGEKTIKYSLEVEPRAMNAEKRVVWNDSYNILLKWNDGWSGNEGGNWDSGEVDDNWEVRPTQKPEIKIIWPSSDWAMSKTVEAIAENEPTLFQYAITTANICDSSLSFSNYTAQEQIHFTWESDNGKYVCFLAKNEVGETFKISNMIEKIDRTRPVCGERVYSTNPSNWTNGPIIVSLSGSYDTWAWILSVWSPCSISSNTTCSITISDNVWLAQECVSDMIHPNIDTQAPIVSFDKESGEENTSHSVVVTVSDSPAWLPANQKIKYRWQTSSTCSTTNSDYTEKALSPTSEWTNSASASVTTPWLDNGSYYLCILWASVSDRAWNTNATTKTVWRFVVNNEHGAATGNNNPSGTLVAFGTNTVYSNWTTTNTIDLVWYQGATWGYMFSNTNNTGSIDPSMWYTPVNSNSTTITISDQSQNYKYVCAFGQSGSTVQTICSDYQIKIDRTEPNISLQYPSNGDRFAKNSSIVLNWNGSDSESGISGYVLNIISPNSNLTYDLAAGNTTKQITINEVWNRYWSVKVCDKVGLCTTSSSHNFSVYDNASGGNIVGSWFYAISPTLGTQINVWNDVVLKWNHGTNKSGYVWEVKKANWDTVVTWQTNGNTVTVSNTYFRAGSYSWSVKDVYTEDIEEIQLFYIVNSSSLPDLKADRFEFDEIEYADLDEYYSSNRITIDWLSDGRYTLVSLKDGKWALYINKKFVWSTGIVQNWDRVHVELKASDKYDKTVSTTLYVGIGNNTVSSEFKVTTKDGINWWDSSSLTPLQKLWWISFIDNLVEMYKYDEEKLATFLSTFMQVLQDKSDYYAQEIADAENDGDEDLVKEYKTYKQAVDFLYTTAKYRLNNLELEDYRIYIAPNGKQYVVKYDYDRLAYTSPDFARAKYFPTWELFVNHIDLNNPAAGKWWILGNVITTHNGKSYTIYETKWKWTSSNFKVAKYFDTKEDIINHILANNPASNWDHRVDTNFDQVSYTAPNGKVYKIFKTSSKWNNPDMYSSYNFVDAKYFTSLDAIKKYISENNKR